jgi:alkaline phosphatase D
VPPDVLEVVTSFPEIVDAELAHRGYIRHTVTPQTWSAEYRAVDDVANPQSTVSTWKTFTVDVGVRDVVTEV